MKNSKVFISTGYYKNINPIETLDYFVKKKIYDIEFSGGLHMNQKDEKNVLRKIFHIPIHLFLFQIDLFYFHHPPKTMGY